MSILESSKAAAASADIGVIDQQIRGYAFNSFCDSSYPKAYIAIIVQTCPESAYKLERSTQ
jgi:hypothetical protein